jgi:DNA (cytosine-5)-methyltransferase 1
MSKSKERITFTLMDAGIKNAGPVEVYDERTLDANGNIISFPTQLAIVSHYCMLQNSPYEKYFQKANDLINCWVNAPKITQSLSVVAEPQAIQYTLFKDFFLAPFRATENPKFSFIDLFAGIGGFRMAAQNLGGSCVFSSEWDAQAQKTYFANYGEVPFGDITTDQTKSFIPKRFDMLCAGFPCQPFSYAGEKKGFEDETRGTLFFDICKILEEHKPPMVFLENVKGLVSHDNGKTLETVLSSLKNLGYFPHWKVLSSLDFGLPQKRERWYCVAFREDIPFEFPKPIGGHPTLRDIVDINDKSPELSLPQFELDRIAYHFAHCHEAERVQHDNSKYAPNTKKGKHGIFSFQKPDGSLRFHVGDHAKTQIQEAFYACLDTYAPTIIANRTPKLWDLRRRLSVKEAKRLQGFPDNFIMPVLDCHALKQLGNSVSVPVIQLIMEQMLYTYKTNTSHL